jgi:NADH dehydrogenase
VILVCGGTGFLGSAIVTELLRRGETVAVLSRDAAKIRQRFGNSVEVRQADVRQPAGLTEAMAGADIVINAVQFPTSPIEVKRRGWTFEATDYRGTCNQADAAKALGVKRFAYLSAVGAAPEGRHWYRFKWQAEQHLQESGLEWVIVRPTWVYGPGDHSLNRLLGYGRFLPFIPMFGDGKQQMQPVFIDDAAKVVADAALRPEAANQVFELGGPEIVPMDTVLRTALDVMGKKRFILYQPAFAGKVMGRLASVLPSPPLSADAVDFITAPAVADNTNLERVLKPELTPLQEGLSTYLRRK